MKSRERFEILKHVLYYSGEQTVTGISSQFGISKGLVSGYLRLLEEFGILERVDRAYILKECSIVNSLKRTINISRIDLGPFQEDWIEGVGVYGSWRSGTNFEESDLDLWFKVRRNPGEDRISAIQYDLQKSLSCEVGILVLTPEKVEMIKQNVPFWEEVIRSEVIVGSGFE